MKKLVLISIVLLGTPVSLWAGNVTIVFDQLKYTGGTIRIAIYDTAEAYDNRGPRTASAIIEVKKQQHQARVTCELKPGKYAATIFHDKNDNQKLDTNFIGIPKEGYGFSNNAQGVFGPPKFDAAVFTMGQDDMEMKIDLQY